MTKRHDNTPLPKIHCTENPQKKNELNTISPTHQGYYFYIFLASSMSSLQAKHKFRRSSYRKVFSSCLRFQSLLRFIEILYFSLLHRNGLYNRWNCMLLSFSLLSHLLILMVLVFSFWCQFFFGSLYQQLPCHTKEIEYSTKRNESTRNEIYFMDYSYFLKKLFY